MPTGTKKVRERMQDQYVEGVVELGLAPRDAADRAGFSPTTKIADIERPGQPVFEKLEAALAKKGITYDSWAREYSLGLQKARTKGARDYDLNAHATYLKQLGYLFTRGGKSGPIIAQQINVGTGAPLGSAAGQPNGSGAAAGDPAYDDPARARELVGQTEALLAALTQEIGRRRNRELRPGDPGAQDAAPLVAVEPAPRKRKAAAARGKP